MPSAEPDKGDKVSWQWGGGAPGGEVAEKKKEGEIAIQSKKGNTIKKNASPDNPAVHIKRSGNDVVKRANEVNVEKKASGGGGSKGGEKRKKEEKEDDNGGLEKNDEGKEVKPGGKAESGKGAKKQKTGDEKQTNGEKKEDKKAAPASKEKKSTGGAAKKKDSKPAKPRDETTVSARTRSRAK